MGINNKLKEIDFKKRMCCYFDDIIKIEDFNFSNIFINQNHTKIFWFLTCHAKL